MVLGLRKGAWHHISVVVHKHVSLKQLGTWAWWRGVCRETRLLLSGWEGSGEQAATLRVMCVRGRVALGGHRHVYHRRLFQSGLFPLISSVRSIAPCFHFSEPYSSVKISKYYLRKRLCMHPCVYTYLYIYYTNYLREWQYQEKLLWLKLDLFLR